MVSIQLIGNLNAKQELSDWLSYYYKGLVVTRCPKCYFPIFSKSDNIACPKCSYSYHFTPKKYAIVWGNSGNGKTHICKYFASIFGVELLRITMDDITSDADINNMIKSFTTASLDGRGKLILIDDCDDFRGSLGAKAIKSFRKAVKISKYPIIFTYSEFPRYDKFIRNAIIVHVKKPFYKEMFNYIKSIKPSLQDDYVDKIIRTQPSFRSIVISALSTVENSMVEQSYITNKELVSMIESRKLSVPLNRAKLKKVFNYIVGYDKYTLSVMERLAYLDFLSSHYKNVLVSYEREINPILINSMKEPIEKVTFKVRYKS